MLTVDVSVRGRRCVVRDAGGPAPLYVSRRLLNAADVAAWARGIGLKSVVAPAEMHVTIAYSKSPVDWFKFPGDGYGSNVDGGPRRLEIFGDGVVVLRFASDHFQRRWKLFRDGGCSWKWPEYAPHVTIAEDVGAVNIAQTVAYPGPLEFGSEIFAPVREK